MNATLELLCESLDELSSKVLASIADNRTLLELYGWNCPPLSRHDLSDMASDLAERIRNAHIETLDTDLESKLSSYNTKITNFVTNTLPHLFTGNCLQAYPVFIALLSSLESQLALNLNIDSLALRDWEAIYEKKLLPPNIIRRVKGIDSQLDAISPDMEALKNQIKQIQDATEAAESLPTDLQNLRDARLEIDRLATGAAELSGKIDDRNDEATKSVLNISDLEEQADKLVQQCEEAYRITTTKGLAAAFDQRAIKLESSMRIWVLGLIIALGLGAALGAERVNLISTALSASHPEWGSILLQMVLALLSVAAPLWFAWIATKQIGQRFRLSEDYAFKASVAKAYEGYRREAARIDEAFEARLFSSALTRLEEAPLRLIETKLHGSPWHELADSQGFKSAIETIPEFRDKILESIKDVLPSTKGKVEGQ